MSLLETTVEACGKFVTTPVANYLVSDEDALLRR